MTQEIWKRTSVAWTLVLLAGLAGGNARAETYYVAPNGSDGAAGTLDAPFQTIQKAANVMTAGDTCYVRAGTYRETVRPANSGEEGHPMAFRAYQGERVIVSGADPIQGWQATEGGRYHAPAGWVFEQLFEDGRMMREARWPNASTDNVWPTWSQADAGSGPKGIVDPKLPSVDLTGAMIHVLPGRHWVSWTRPVQGLDRQGGVPKVLFEGSWSQEDAYVIEKGTAYYLFRAPSLLDAPGEWYLDRKSLNVSFIPRDGDDPGRHRVEAKRRELAFDLRGRQFVDVEGFCVFAATIQLGDSVHCAVRQCHFRYPWHTAASDGWSIPDSGLIVGGHDNELRECSILYSAGNGITLGGENNRVADCLVQNVDYMASDCGAVFASGTGNVVEYCTLSDTGRSVLLHRTLKAGRIEYNDLYNAGLLTTDLGITYCFNTDGEGTIIAYNWVHDNKAGHVGVGIYIDNDSRNFIIHHNVSWNNPDSGIRLNTPSHNNWVCNNTVLDNGNSVSYWGPNGMKDQAGVRIINNIFTDKVETGTDAEVSNNYEGKTPGIVSIQNRDFELKADSPCIDAGKILPQIPGEFLGKAPDLGAYEYGRAPFKPGHDWGAPPEF